MMLEILDARNAAAAVASHAPVVIDVESLTLGESTDSDVECLSECVVVSDDDSTAPIEHPFGGLGWVAEHYDDPGSHIGLHPRPAS